MALLLPHVVIKLAEQQLYILLKLAPGVGGVYWLGNGKNGYAIPFTNFIGNLDGLTAGS
ncbi:MAG: hypothetical protein JNM68_06370 [Dinghuibacter sp.]|nr:hypothetical protein [Dinghuibacter sp.]